MGIIVLGVTALWVACSGPKGPGFHGPERADVPGDRPGAKPDAKTPPHSSPGAKTVPSPSRPQEASFQVRKLLNLKRLGTLTPSQKSLLSSQGFFLADQPALPKGVTHRATHLFHVYERNDYVAFPSFITVDLAIDLTHAYFSAVLKEIERDHVIPRLEKGLTALLEETERLWKGARTKEARREAARALAFWGVALGLLATPAQGDAPEDGEEPIRLGQEDLDDPPRRPASRRAKRPRATRATAHKGPSLPRPIRAQVDAALKAAHRAQGSLPAGILRSTMDLTQLKPRGHYTQAGKMQRYFRAMSWLGMASFPVAGSESDVPLIAILARVWLGSPEGAKFITEVRDLTAFFAGGPDATDLNLASSLLKELLPEAATARPEALVEKAFLARLAESLGRLPAPRIQSTATSDTAAVQVRVIGRRAFEDNVALQEILGAVTNIVAAGKDQTAETRLVGPLATAAFLGSDLAERLLVQPTPDVRHDALKAAIGKGRAHISGLPPTAWKGDAYHGTLHALAALLPLAPATAPQLLRSEGWRIRALGAFAAGWTELRHDTILYGEQSGAECDAEDPPPPPGWVEPLPEVYERLASMVTALEKNLVTAKVPMQEEPKSGHPYARPLAEKTKSLVGFLRFLRDVSRDQLAGRLPTDKQRRRITLLGGEAEWILISLANTDLLSPRDQDMAVVADVFTWRTAGKAVQVAVGHPELMYAIIPAPGGSVLARGAVMSYREFLGPQTNRLTNEEWRARLAGGTVPPRPAWLAPIYAEPLPAIQPIGQGVDRCGPASGTRVPL